MALYYAHGQPADDCLNTWNYFRRQLSRPKLQLQNMRHAFANLLLKFGMDIREIQITLGHYDKNTLAILMEKKYR